MVGKELVEAQDLVLRYGSHVVVDRVSLAVGRGSLFGLLGHNGAGKTSTVEMLEGLRSPSEGHIYCCGIDVRRHPRQARALMGIQLQKGALFDQLTVRETLQLFSGISRRPPLATGALIEYLDLDSILKAQVKHLSGGQFQRLALATAIINDPAVIFLDEPTTGLDPLARRMLWKFVLELKQRGKAIILTTHYMEEAEALCDRVGILQNGKMIAEGKPGELSGSHAVLSFRLEPTVSTEDQESLAQLPHVIKIDYSPDGEIKLLTGESLDATTALAAWAAQRNKGIRNLEIRRPTLEDVFLELTGDPEAARLST